MANIDIRPATSEDSGLILYFVRQLAIYEKAEHEVVATEEDIRTALFCDSAGAEAVICNVDGEVAGFALYFFNFSTWQGKYGLYLEDLYVDPQYRGAGAGKALLKHCGRVALARGCGRFEWNVLDWNQPAIDFYESFGARPQHEWVGYRLEGEALRAFGAD